MSAPSIHHVGILVYDEKPTLKLFQKQLGFEIVCTRQTSIDKKWVLQKNRVRFVVTKLLLHHASESSSCHFYSQSQQQHQQQLLHDGDGQSLLLPHFSTVSGWQQTLSSQLQCQHSSSINSYYDDRTTVLEGEQEGGGCPISSSSNSVYEVCFEVRDVKRSIQQAVDCGASILQPLTVATSNEGEVAYATIKSCVGNVQHTILNTKKFHGRFLPGFDDTTTTSPLLPDRHTEILDDFDFDHITLCVPPLKTFEAISWYQNCFSMHRLIVNRNESVSDGLMLSDLEMRMAAMEYWRCSESGVALDSSMTSVKFIIVESRSDKPNQVTTFLKQHGGPGIQHIGLITERLVDNVREFKDNGVLFIQPPSEYYNEIGKLKEITDCGESVEMLEGCGILLDSEADCSVENGDTEDDPMNMYLMQIFAKPIFGDDTFFLEFLQRHGAKGFGAGNITALWKAVQLYMEKGSAN